MSSPNQLSFLPDDYLEKKAQRRTNVICAILCITVMAAVASAFGLTQKSIRALEENHRSIDRQYTEAAKRIEQVRQMREKQHRMARQAELTASLLEKVPRSYLLAEITNAMPAGVSLLDFSMESKVRAVAPPPAAAKTAFEQKKAEMARKNPAPEATPARQYDVTMKLTGVAQTDVHVAQFINRLSRSNMLREVNLVISDQYEQADMKLRKFQIEMTMNSGATVPASATGENRTAAVDVMAR